jgi:DtxR family Mn-dependent transcriptional regulator
MEPGLLILIGLCTLAFLLWVFWPKRGLFALLNSIRLNKKRVLLEDTLKYLFDCEYKNSPCRLNTIAGHLHISADQTTHLIDRLRHLGLIQLEGKEFRLTDTGKSYALRIIRIHRIWERYLADETSIAPLDWHGEADQHEHRLSAKEANRLAARMGNPVFDPHGDPIPTAEGAIPDHKGTPLSSLQEGAIARIVHIEDEPHTIYQQLLAQGLYLGMQIYVFDVDDDKITFAADGEECVLTFLFAENITVELLPSKKEGVPAKNRLLTSLAIGEQAEVSSISPKCRGRQRRRLMDLGVVPGTTVTALMRSASGDPVAYRILGTTIALRRDQADLIFIQPIQVEQHEQAAKL